MKNVFDKIGDISNNIRRNNFDWSHDNNFTTGFGRVTPVFCETCPPNSSIRLKPTFGLRFMPMMFPVQTKVKAYLSFYRMPIRALWSEYTDFISSANDPNATFDPPYIDTKNAKFDEGEFLGPSGLSDYLGVPVVASFPETPIALAGVDVWDKVAAVGGITGIRSLSSLWTGESVTNSNVSNHANVALMKIASIPDGTGDYTAVHVTYTMAFTTSDKGQSFYNALVNARNSVAGNSASCGFATTAQDINSSYQAAFYDCAEWSTGNRRVRVDVNEDYTEITMSADMLVRFGGSIYAMLPGFGNTIFNTTTIPVSALGEKFATAVYTPTVQLNSRINPYYNSSSSDSAKQVKLSAYPYRCYEAIYNAYMRNIKNNPFMLNGKPVYNKFITNNAGGADLTEYKLFRANWASDAFTTAVPSPQQGQAPLVGITTYTEEISLENGNTQNVLKFAVVDEDGKKYGVDFESNGEALKGVKYTELGANTAVAPVSNLYDLVTSGISINDFRNVNAYQRYLELNMFKGYNYRDIIQGRFECNVHYDTLLMPEYIGGFTRDVVINPITQTVQTAGDGSYVGALGSQAGDAICFGQSDASISCFCDEESIVMGILSVVPMPIYTQALPKHFLYRERLDTFNPEFDHIGFQPIQAKELCPIQQYATMPSDGGQHGDLEAVFGYQRPWYEYVQKRDSAHGLFLTDLRNFLINRVFGAMPELGAEFTTIKESEVNNVFSVTEVSDKILGQIHFDCTAKLPISRVVVPKLE